MSRHKGADSLGSSGLIPSPGTTAKRLKAALERSKRHGPKATNTKGLKHRRFWYKQPRERMSLEEFDACMPKSVPPDEKK